MQLCYILSRQFYEVKNEKTDTAFNSPFSPLSNYVLLVIYCHLEMMKKYCVFQDLNSRYKNTHTQKHFGISGILLKTSNLCFQFTSYKKWDGINFSRSHQL